jgi:SWI/SNF-related matrix-associated actin-dependent regulator of chromatin subfamily A member 5
VEVDDERVDAMETEGEPTTEGDFVEIDESKAVKSYLEIKKERDAKLVEFKAQLEAQQQEDKESADAEKRLQFLMAQTEVFSHFLSTGGTGAFASSKPSKSTKSKGTGRSKVSEKAEDESLLQAVQSGQTVTRLLKQPALIESGEMRAYQIEGLNWMINLHDNNINGILADEMGLGKTLQTISLLAYLRESRNISGPHMVIVPKSTVSNWLREFRRWCPVMRTVKLLGTKVEREKAIEVVRSKKFDVCIASYESCLLEQSALTRFKWNYTIIDEAHRIKNEKSSLSKMVRALKTEFRLLITGTPLQNNLHELWALLNFLMPEVFDSAEAFDSWFNTEDDEAKDNVIKKLHTVLKPFMLRRIKDDVEHSLLPKIETKLYIGMTPMQRTWYTKMLAKDIESLNALGGTDKVRLMNLLVQLRKVCNHPYLFEGAEQGPPYIDGPHIYENAGKMNLLHKLLTKLKANGNRVLIFCQMTRMLDIIEDYLRYQQYQYCRIDGQSNAETRDIQMDEFNKPGSEKFCFVLSTRAGGLGINLQTADTVILYDSDWNPQVDLQAMDRAHRIGQTKQVRVFRFITDGTIEEKVVERADRKLYLDAAVIQQGRLAAANSSLSKGELMTMIKFGADEIMNSRDREFTDEDIDALLARGEERTASAKEKISTDMQHSLAKFSLDGSSEVNVFNFEDVDYKERRGGKAMEMGTATFVNLPQRERKRAIYDVDEYFKESLGLQPQSKDKGKKRVRGVTMHEYQFYDKTKMDVVEQRESNLALQIAAQKLAIRKLRDKQRIALKGGIPQDDYDEIDRADVEVYELAVKLVDIGSADMDYEKHANRMSRELEDGKFDIPQSLVEEKASITKEAFVDWTKRDFRCFTDALEKNGRSDVKTTVREVAFDTGRSEDEVARYASTFWQRYKELSNWEKLIEKIELAERRTERNREVASLLEWKVRQYEQPWREMRVVYGSNKGRVYSDEEDNFLVLMMNRHGYGAWERIKNEIRNAWQFKMDFFFLSRNAIELSKRCETLIKCIEREKEDVDSMTIDQ